MSFPEAAVTFLLENISQALQHYYHLIADARGNVMELQQQLEELKRVMNDFSKYNHDSEIVEGIVKEIKAIIFDAEDAVDTFLLYAGAQKARGWLERTYHQITDYPKKLLEVGVEMNRISDKIKAINQDGVSRGLQLIQHQATIRLIKDDDETAFKVRSRNIWTSGQTGYLKLMCGYSVSPLELSNVIPKSRLITYDQSLKSVKDHNSCCFCALISRVKRR